MIKRKRNAKKKLIIISVAVVICILACAIVGGFMVHDYIQKNPLRAPTWYVCKQIEKEIPIGTDADTVIEIMKSKDDWSKSEDTPYNKTYRLNKGPIGVGIAYNAFFYSFNKLDYRNISQGNYYTGTFLGSVPQRGTEEPWGYSVSAMFIFDENKQLMDIIVFRNYVGI